MTHYILYPKSVFILILLHDLLNLHMYIYCNNIIMIDNEKKVSYSSMYISFSKLTGISHFFNWYLFFILF